MTLDKLSETVEKLLPIFQNVRFELIIVEILKHLSLPTFRIEQLLSKYWGNYSIDYGIPACFAVNSKLQTKGNSFTINDAEFLRIVDQKGRAIIVATSPTESFLFVASTEEIHVRKLNDEFDLDYFASTNFDVSMKDSPNSSYVLSCDKNREVVDAIYRHQDIQSAFDLCLSFMIESLYPAGPVDTLSKRFGRGGLILTKKTTEEDFLDLEEK